MNYHKTCDHCGQVTTAYTVHLNRPLALAFLVFADTRIRVGRPVKKGELELSNSQYGNFQKLRHFGVVEKRDGGAWEMTPVGWSFLAGKTLLLNPAGHFGNATLPEGHPAWSTHEEPRVPLKLSDALPEEWRQRAEYVAEKKGVA